jgi:hypothetical protein
MEVKYWRKKVFLIINDENSHPIYIYSKTGAIDPGLGDRLHYWRGNEKLGILVHTYDCEVYTYDCVWEIFEEEKLQPKF